MMCMGAAVSLFGLLQHCGKVEVPLSSAYLEQRLVINGLPQTGGPCSPLKTAQDMKLNDRGREGRET